MESSTPDDPKIRAVEARHGVAGIGALFKVWCFVASQGSRPGWSLDSRGRAIAKRFLVQASGLAEPTYDALLETLVEIDHVNGDEYRDHGVLVFPAMERRADTYTKRAQKGVYSNSVRSGVTQRANSVGLQHSTRQYKQHSTRITSNPSTRKNSARRAPARKKAVENSPYRVILRLAHDVIKRTPKGDQSFAGLKSDLKYACAKNHIQYDAHVVGRALESALATTGNRKRAVTQ